MKTVEVTSRNFGQTTGQGVVILDFWAGWCAPCRAFAPIFSKAAERHPNVTFGKVDTEAQQELALRFGIRSIPTVMAFKDGQPVFQQPGVLPAPTLDRLVEELLKLDLSSLHDEQ